MIVGSIFFFFFFFSSRRRHTRFDCDWSSDVCSSDLVEFPNAEDAGLAVADDAERLTTITFATTWWLHRFFRLSLDVVHERYGGGIDVDGEELDSLTGFLLRAQVDF